MHRPARFLVVTTSVAVVLGILSCGCNARTAPTEPVNQGWPGPNLTGTWAGTLRWRAWELSLSEDIQVTFALSGPTVTGQFHVDVTKGSIVLTNGATLGGMLTVEGPGPDKDCLMTGPITGALSGEELRFSVPRITGNCPNESFDYLLVLRRQ